MTLTHVHNRTWKFQLAHISLALFFGVLKSAKAMSKISEDLRKKDQNRSEQNVIYVVVQVLPFLMKPYYFAHSGKWPAFV